MFTHKACSFPFQISSVLQLSSAIANLIDVQGSSCLVSLGDGSEVTSQVKYFYLELFKNNIFQIYLLGEIFSLNEF